MLSDFAAHWTPAPEFLHRGKNAPCVYTVCVNPPVPPSSLQFRVCYWSAHSFKNFSMKTNRSACSLTNGLCSQSPFKNALNYFTARNECSSFMFTFQYVNIYFLVSIITLMFQNTPFKTGFHSQREPFLNENEPINVSKGFYFSSENKHNFIISPQNTG